MAQKEDRSTTVVTRRKFLAATSGTAVAAIAGCTRDGNADGEATDGQGTTESDLSGNVVVTGSSTVYPVSVAMAEDFQSRHADVDVSVDSTGSGGGFQNHFCPGNSDVNGASRPIVESEEELCGDNGVTPLEFQIASDALTVAVNNDAHWVDCVTFDQLAQIWQPDGAETWADVDPDWPDEPFELYGPASTSGTFDWFTEHVIGEFGSMREDYEPTEEDNIIIQGIEGSEHAMGFFGYSYYLENRDRVKALEIKEDEDDSCTEPSLENARTGDYPMARPLFIYVAEESLAEPPVREFTQFYLENAATDLVEEVGYVPVSEQQAQENLETLEAAVDDVE